MTQPSVRFLVTIKGINPEETEALKDRVFSNPYLQTITFTHEGNRVEIRVDTEFPDDEGDQLSQLNRVVSGDAELVPFGINYETEETDQNAVCKIAAE